MRQAGLFVTEIVFSTRVCVCVCVCVRVCVFLFHQLLQQFFCHSSNMASCDLEDVFVCVCVWVRSEEHTSELQSHLNLVCPRLREKKRACVLAAVVYHSVV